jgi:hypothetical protein
MSSWDTSRGGPDSKARRSQRVIVGVPVTVSNEGGNRAAAFEEETLTLAVNAHGAMVAIAAKVTKGQAVRLKNRVTQEVQVCKVVYLGPTTAGKVQVGVEFVTSSPDFWRIAFPPEDWVMPAPDPVPTTVKKK